MKYFIGGAAGFIGSSLIKKLLSEQKDIEIIGYDNLSFGKLALLSDALKDSRLKFVKGDIQDLDFLVKYMKGCNVVYHFASNADIAKAMSDPTIDFYQGTLLTQNILEAMRINGIKKIIYASGSGIFGEVNGVTASEDYYPMLPISTYGASKLAGEALICAYCHMFDITGRVYRFANVIGGNTTHSVILDFVNKLNKNPEELVILGNGQQNKGYLYIDDILNGILMTESACTKQYEYFNLAPDDQITVNEIANVVVSEMELDSVQYKYTGDISWKGDVAVIKMGSEKIRSYGWKPTYTSKEAITKSVKELLKKQCIQI